MATTKMQKAVDEEARANLEMYRLAREGKRGTKEYLQAWRRAINAGKGK